MSFATDAQMNEALHVLLARVRLQRLWTSQGPTDEACDLLQARGGPLSSGERVMLLAAFDIYNGFGALPFERLVNTLGAEHLRAVCGLVVARAEGGPAVEAWIESQQSAPRSEARPTGAQSGRTGT